MTKRHSDNEKKFKRFHDQFELTLEVIKQVIGNIYL